MRAAQTLYEGVDIAGYGTVGLITYMRTDSLRISDEAVAAARGLYRRGLRPAVYLPVQAHLEDQKRPPPPRDAHEAIRPSMPALDPRRGG